VAFVEGLNVCMVRLGIFGGTFNPIHWGHLVIAEAALDQFGLDSVLWLPSRFPPHKLQSLVAFEHRLEMVRLAIADHPQFVLSEVERQREGVSWAIDSFGDLQHTYPATQWYWIIGTDAFETLTRWPGIQQISRECIWLVAGRRGATEVADKIGDRATADSPSDQENEAVRSQSIEMPSVEISSSLVRQYCQEGRSLRYLIPEPVRQYVQTHQLYQS
jgi:nicotinate-nucleotide adenylyltransferase